MSAVDKLRELASAATPGRWTVSGKGTVKAGRDVWIARMNWRNREANAAFVAACDPPTILAQLDEIDAQEDQAARYRDEIAGLEFHTAHLTELLDDARAERDAARREAKELREVLEHLNAEIVFGGQLQELVDTALGAATEKQS